MVPEENDKAHSIKVVKEQRELLSAARAQAAILSAENHPPVVQEIVLAQRAIEDARMRYGVALALLEGQDPFPLSTE